MTKTGNAHVRRVLVESARHYRHHPFISATIRARQRGAPADSVARAWTAQQRLHRRYQRLAARGKPKQHIVTAVARELTGFVWAALTHILIGRLSKGEPSEFLCDRRPGVSNSRP